MTPLAVSALVAGGGAIGALARYWLSVTAVGLFGASFPVGTFVANIVGGFLIGLIAAGAWAGEGARAFLITGVLGGFTTFSAFSLEVIRMIEADRLALAGGYAALSVALSVAAAGAGVALARA